MDKLQKGNLINTRMKLDHYRYHLEDRKWDGTNSYLFDGGFDRDTKHSSSNSIAIFKHL